MPKLGRIKSIHLDYITLYKSGNFLKIFGKDESINYMLVDPRNNYDVDVKENFKNLNRYTEQFE